MCYMARLIWTLRMNIYLLEIGTKTQNEYKWPGRRSASGSLEYTNHKSPPCPPPPFLYEKLWRITGNFSGPPSPPIITSIDVNYNAIKVTWEIPPSKQDTPITGHVLQIRNKLDQFKKWEDFKFSAKSNYFILGGLSKGTHYGVRLYATNVAGQSNASDEKQVKTPMEG